jgi:hypothetical protein
MQIKLLDLITDRRRELLAPADFTSAQATAAAAGQSKSLVERFCGRRFSRWAVQVSNLRPAD